MTLTPEQIAEKLNGLSEDLWDWATRDHDVGISNGAGAYQMAQEDIRAILNRHLALEAS